MNKSYHVRLTDTERAHLTELIAAGTAPARKLLHARILLKADEGPAGLLGETKRSPTRSR